MKVFFVAVLFAALAASAQGNKEVFGGQLDIQPLTAEQLQVLETGEEPCGAYFVKGPHDNGFTLSFQVTTLYHNREHKLGLSLPLERFVVYVDRYRVAPVAMINYDKEGQWQRIAIRLSPRDYEAAKACLPQPQKY